jgi:carbonic anhydrase
MFLTKLPKVIVLTLLATFASCAQAHSQPAWGYGIDDGPEKWGKLSPRYAMCATGKSQSPINITDVIQRKSALAVHYDPAALVIEVDGNTALNIHGQQTITNTGHGVQVNFNKREEAIAFLSKRYQLVQFHFHTPSENLVNGQSYPMEIHFVHQSANGGVAVIAVFVEEGKKSQTLQKIIDKIPAAERIPQEIPDEEINPSYLIPADQSYYHYKGSLTTPPCSEGLEWLVMKDPITATAEQIAKIKEISHGDNARPVQALDRREIFYTGE